MPTSDTPPSGLSAGARGWLTSLAMATFVVGIGAIVVQEAFKLDADPLLTWGVYLKEGFRQALLSGGLLAMGLGIILAVVASLGSRAARGLAWVTGACLLVVGTGGALAVIGMAVKREQQPTTYYAPIDE